MLNENANENASELKKNETELLEKLLEKNEIVYPGSFLCYSEEFEPAENAFEDVDSRVFATVVGVKRESKPDRSVSVTPAAPAKRLIRVGDLAYARVEDLYEKVALLSMQPASKHVAAFDNFAYLRISEVKRGFVESFRGYLGIGDFIKARVVEVNPLGVYLSIADPSLGVIKAFCSNCRRELKKTLKGLKGLVHCENCGSEESRKLALKLAPRALGALRERETREIPRGLHERSERLRGELRGRREQLRQRGGRL